MGKGKDNIVVSKELQIILEKINKSLEDKESLTECGFKIKSLWMFRHVPQIRSFKSWGYLAIDQDVKKAYNEKSYGLKERVSKQVIPEDIGSIGKAFKQEKEKLDWLFVPNTYDAPEGTVVELDLRLGHQSVLFVPFKVKKDIVAILLISTATFEEKKKPDIQKRIKETFKNNGINELIQLAYWNERNKDVIANVKKATMNFVSTGTTPVNETMKDIISSEITTPEVFVRDHFISPIKEFNQGVSFVPIIEIEDKHHLQKPLWGYSDVVYDKLKQRLSESIKSEDYKEDSNDNALVLSFTNNYEKSPMFNINLEPGCQITYVLNVYEGVDKDMKSNAGSFRAEADVLVKAMESNAVSYKAEADGLVKNFCKQCDPKTSLIIKKKYISEKLNQTYKYYGHTPFYLVLEKSDLSLYTGTLTFDKELIASNLNDKTFPLDDYREELIGKNGFYNFTVKEDQSKLIDGLVFRVYTDEKRKKEDIFNEDVKAFIDQRCLYYKLLLDQKQAKKNAVRAAIAQVMARNMSHNFGSHVLSNLISNDAYSMLTDRNILKAKAYVSPWETKMKYPKEQVQIVKSHSGNFQLSYFNQYLKSRMDYLSEVTFGVSNLLTTKMMYGEVMKELDQVRILLNYISGVSNFKYTFKLMIVDEKGEEKEMTADKDIGVAFPSDVLGCHAFYNIIENIIRNTAKHAKNTGDVTFTIKFKDVADAVCKHIEEAAELYCVEIDNGVFEYGINELVNKQNDRLNQSVLENNNLRSNSLGLLEMEASAAFLRQIDLPEIESEDYTIDYGTPEELSRYYHERNGKKHLNILKAFAIDKQQDNTGRLGYRFFVQKPKEFLFVGNWDDVGKAKKKEMLNIGIQFISANQFMTDLEKEKAFAHQFMVYDSSLCEAVAEKLKKASIISNKYNNDNNDKSKEIKEQLRSYSTLLPLRKLKISEDEKKTISSYWSSNKQVNSSKGKTSKVGNAHDKAILQKLKERAWERYYQNELLKEEMMPSSEIFIRTSIDTNPSNQVVFLDHANEGGHLKECSEIPKGKEVYIENLTSQTRVKLPVFTELSKGRKEKLINNYVNNIRASNNDDSDLSGKKRMIREEIFEAYHNKVIILDERVQQFAEKNSEGEEPKIPCWKLFSSTNVHIPRRPKYDNNGNPIPLEDLYGNELDVDDFRVFSLDPTDFGEIKEKVKTFVDYYSKEYNPKSKLFILVHYGILERMYDGDVEKINELLKQWVEMSKRVVVTSGRGAHSLDLPKSVCFVNLSSVLYVCNENRNKYLINYLLNQSRRKRNE